MVKRKSSKRSMFELERELKAERAKVAELRVRLHAALEIREQRLATIDTSEKSE